MRALAVRFDQLVCNSTQQGQTIGQRSPQSTCRRQCSRVHSQARPTAPAGALRFPILVLHVLVAHWSGTCANNRLNAAPPDASLTCQYTRAVKDH